MSQEASITVSLSVIKGYVNHRSPVQTYKADITNAKGPCIGAKTIAVFGTDIDFSELTQPGLCKITNQDTTNYVRWGIWYAGISRFFPVGKLLPGEAHLLRWDDFIGDQLSGTGTVDAGDVTVRFEAHLAPCNVLFEQFDT